MAASAEAVELTTLQCVSAISYTHAAAAATAAAAAAAAAANVHPHQSRIQTAATASLILLPRQRTQCTLGWRLCRRAARRHKCAVLLLAWRETLLVRSVCRSIVGQPVRRSVGLSAGQPILRFIGQSIGRSVGQSVLAGGCSWRCLEAAVYVPVISVH